MRYDRLDFDPPIREMVASRRQTHGWFHVARFDQPTRPNHRAIALTMAWVAVSHSEGGLSS